VGDPWSGFYDFFSGDAESYDDHDFCCDGAASASGCASDFYYNASSAHEAREANHCGWDYAHAFPGVNDCALNLVHAFREVKHCVEGCGLGSGDVYGGAVLEICYDFCDFLSDGGGHESDFVPFPIFRLHPPKFFDP